VRTEDGKAVLGLLDLVNWQARQTKMRQVKALMESKTRTAAMIVTLFSSLTVCFCCNDAVSNFLKLLVFSQSCKKVCKYHFMALKIKKTLKLFKADKIHAPLLADEMVWISFVNKCSETLFLMTKKYYF
jgi:hypothetical protein